MPERVAALIRFLIRRYGEQRVIEAVEEATECRWYPSTNPAKARRQKAERKAQG